MAIEVIDVHYAHAHEAAPGLVIQIRGSCREMADVDAVGLAMRLAQRYGFAVGGVGQIDLPVQRGEDGLCTRLWWFTDCELHERAFCETCAEGLSEIDVLR